MLTGDVSSASEMADHIRAVGTSRSDAAFLALFKYYAPKLKTYFGKIGVPASLADDLIQETMLTIWNKAHYFDPEKGSSSAWVFTIARNLRVTDLRRHRLAPVGELYAEYEEPAPQADVQLAAAETESRLRRALENLPDQQATLLKDWFLEEKSHLEIASARNLPLGTVKSHLRRALTRLRKVLSEVV